ncbi:MAG: DUF3567 domain-containing protein [Brachymonas sp.]|nr:DUF3567 domain-containing protein [Brachymonas sp.]
MTTLYDSDAFIVVHMYGLPAAEEAAGEAARVDRGPRLGRDGFEIVDKRSGRHVYLEGSWAERFERQIRAWRHTTPTQEEVEDALEHYAGLAGNPMVLH